MPVLTTPLVYSSVLFTSIAVITQFPKSRILVASISNYSMITEVAVIEALDTVCEFLQ